ncbi:hypothetical protein DPMN_127773 [Dreissena polymorpha]|uniref:Alpha/beta hydrolase fold-3 domain-containing protein n=1 Tax=Dreissena polymorpha TaxID=45954 RepID=A0A9D4JWT4_DREPO|nr:hypothetical protein DPMN_127773 [Dreissena polymorpha]
MLISILPLFQDYLRVWARELEMPILSVDYSLAPEQPFPRALEETFYAYAWALKYPEKLGWTGERICFAGDSAGGNLVLTTALRAVSFQIRVPDGIMAAYPTTMVQYEPSPARLMSMIDPLLPVGILTRVLAAYSGIADKFSSALATPIFCNPAKYETWEVVETAEVVEESSSLPTNEIAECNGHSPNEKCSCNHVELTANQNLSAQSMFFAQQNRCGTEVNAISVNSRCSSIDTITDDEFVVYDLDGTQTSMKLKQTDGSNCDNKIESALPRYSIQSSSTNMSILPDQCSKDHALNCAEAVGNKVLDMASGKDLNQVSVVESEDTNSSKEQHPKLKNTDQRFFGSFEEMMATLNSNITVQENCDDSATATKDLYAVCQELLHEDSGRLSVDMKSTICKSIEDMDELGDQAPIESFVCEEQQAFNTEPKNEEIDIRNKRRKINQKQPSLSGANSSWIHGDTDIERGREPVNSDIGLERGSEVVCNDKDIERESKAVPSDTDKERSHESVQRDQMGEGDNSKPRTHSNIETYITNTPAHTDMLNSKKRTLSLDLPVSFHPGQKSQISKSPDKMLLSTSDFSPKLSPGAGKCTPKLYSVQRKIAQSPIHLFRKLPIVKNYFMSPLLAPDEFLMGLPEVHLAACHFDPLLDDSVMFARKLQSLGRPVTLKVYDYLPHGFLSFGHASKEASLASNGCLDMIKQVLIKLERF